jgi:deoxyribonuclease-4
VIDTDALIAVVRDAGAPVILETPGGPPERGSEISLLREALA